MSLHYSAWSVPPGSGICAEGKDRRGRMQYEAPAIIERVEIIALLKGGLGDSPETHF